MSGMRGKLLENTSHVRLCRSLSLGVIQTGGWWSYQGEGGVLGSLDGDRSFVGARRAAVGREPGSGTLTVLRRTRRRGSAGR